MSCDFFPGKDEVTAGYEGMVITCMRAVNAIPYVAAAKAGVLHSMDLPLTLPKESFRSNNTEPTMKGYGDNQLEKENLPDNPRQVLFYSFTLRKI